MEDDRSNLNRTDDADASDENGGRGNSRDYDIIGAEDEHFFDEGDGGRKGESEELVTEAREKGTNQPGAHFTRVRLVQYGFFAILFACLIIMIFFAVTNSLVNEEGVVSPSKSVGDPIPVPSPSMIPNQTLSFSSMAPTNIAPSIDLLPLQLNVDVNEASQANITEIGVALCEALSQYQMEMLSALYDNLEEILCEAEKTSPSARYLQEVDSSNNATAITSVSFVLLSRAIFTGVAPVAQEVYTTQEAGTNITRLELAMTEIPAIRGAGASLSQFTLAGFPSSTPSLEPSQSSLDAAVSSLPTSPQSRSPSQIPVSSDDASDTPSAMSINVPTLMTSPSLVPSLSSTESINSTSSPEVDQPTLTPVGQPPYHCNICGCDGCTYQRPTALLEFEYNGKPEANTCSKWDEISQTSVGLSADFCRYELPVFAREACGCVDENGQELGPFVPPGDPTAAPTPISGNTTFGPTVMDSTVPTLTESIDNTSFPAIDLPTLTPVGQPPYHCNICGCDGCTYQRPTALLEFEYNGKPEANTCSQWDEISQTAVGLSAGFCRYELPVFAREACGCVDENGQELGPFVPPGDPTAAPTPISANITFGPTVLDSTAVTDDGGSGSGNATNNSTTDLQESLFPESKPTIDGACSSIQLDVDGGALCASYCDPVFFDCCNPFDPNQLYNVVSTDEKEAARSDCGLDYGTQRGCVRYAKCHTLRSGYDPAPEVLPLVCSSQEIERDANKCREYCEPHMCCFATEDDNCIADRLNVCIDYAPCNQLNNESSVVLTAPANLDETCTSGLPKCDELCALSNCCIPPEKNQSKSDLCLQDNFVACLTYVACSERSLLPTPPQFSAVPPPPKDLPKVCAVQANNVTGINLQYELGGGESVTVSDGGFVLGDEGTATGGGDGLNADKESPSGGGAAAVRDGGIVGDYGSSFGGGASDGAVVVTGEIDAVLGTGGTNPKDGSSSDSENQSNDACETYCEAARCCLENEAAGNCFDIDPWGCLAWQQYCKKPHGGGVDVPQTQRNPLLIRERIQRVTGIDLLEDDSSPYKKALDWIISTDPQELSIRDNNLVQRFLTAYLYYATSVNKPWFSCGPPKEDETAECTWMQLVSVKPLTRFPVPSYRLLSERHECEWAGVQCDESGQIRSFDFAGAIMTGGFPTGIRHFPFLQAFNAKYNELTGTIPSEVGEMKHLVKLDLGSNSFTGTLPLQIWRSRSLHQLDVSSNRLGGSLPGSAQETNATMDLDGEISVQFVSLEEMNILDLAENEIKGGIPSAFFASLTNLEVLRLENNLLTGSIPSTIGTMESLRTLNFAGNTLTSVPLNITTLMKLEVLDLGRNQLGGTIPSELGNLSALRALYMDDNEFRGSIPTQVGNLVELRDGLDLSRNALTGSIPSEMGLLVHLNRLWLNSNNLTGSIPVRLASINSIKSIRLDDNDITGAVPDAVCQVYDVTRPTSYIDCGGDKDEKEVLAPCFTFCCTDGVGCVCMYEETDPLRCLST